MSPQVTRIRWARQPGARRFKKFCPASRPARAMTSSRLVTALNLCESRVSGDSRWGVRADFGVGCLRGLPAWLGEADLVGEYYGLKAIAEVEFAEQPVDVRFDRRFADNELAGNLAIGEAAGDECEDFAFAVGQLFEFGGRCS